MKWTLQAVLLLAMTVSGTGKAQERYPASVATGDNLINIALDEVNKTFIAPPERLKLLKSAKTPGSSIQVTYHNFPENAKIPFEYAVRIWESLIESSVPIKIEAHWESLQDKVLAKGKPAVFYSNFSGAPIPNTYYPVALAEKLSNKDLNPGNPDIVCYFNQNVSWYFGTDGNTPSNQYDFVSSVLHEITHGLGFSGFLRTTDNKGFFNNNNNQPSIYDVFIFNNFNQKITDKNLFQSPSVELCKQITSDNLKFAQAGTENQVYTIDWIYAPTVWNEGSSIYHLKGYSYGEENSLMTPAAKKGQAIHNPGKITMDILAELGWDSANFDFKQLKDIEEPVAEIPVSLKINSDKDISSVKIIFSSENSANLKSAELTRKGTSPNFEGKLPIQYATGKIEYYIEARTAIGRVYREPASAPVNKFAMQIGTDYYIPDLFHNPVKVISCNAGEIELCACVTDNVGVKTVYAEYKINGVLQKPVQFTNKGNDFYSGKIKTLCKNIDKLEYRIVAVDNARHENKRSFPSMGYQQIRIYSPENALNGYHTDFSNASKDFILSDFHISSLDGLAGSQLHTQNPYPSSLVEQQHYDMTATLKHPIIIKSGGIMTFDEVVLTEPGSREKNPQNWDYVVVETSKDGGYSWNPITKYYDAGENDTWYSAFSNNFSNWTSTAKPHENMFVNRTISLIRNSGLAAGDTVLFRFRMSSDNSVNGFGWIISNLKIQDLNTVNEELFAKDSYQVYPNPATDRLFIEWTESVDHDHVEIVLFDLYGKIIRKKTETDTFYTTKTQLDLSGITPGIYIVSINNGKKIISTEKIIKN